MATTHWLLLNMTHLYFISTLISRLNITLLSATISYAPAISGSCRLHLIYNTVLRLRHLILYNFNSFHGLKPFKFNFSPTLRSLLTPWSAIQEVPLACHAIFETVTHSPRWKPRLRDYPKDCRAAYRDTCHVELANRSKIRRINNEQNRGWKTQQDYIFSSSKNWAPISLF